MEAEEFRLKWNNFPLNITNNIDELRKHENYVDVTIYSEGKFIQAHKIILSASSSMFKNIFDLNSCQHPVIILQDVKYRELNALITFIYKGEVIIEQQNLPELLKAAQTLQISGLTDCLKTSNSNDTSSNYEQPSKKRKIDSQSNNSNELNSNLPSISNVVPKQVTDIDNFESDNDDDIIDSEVIIKTENDDEEFGSDPLYIPTVQNTGANQQVLQFVTLNTEQKLWNILKTLQCEAVFDYFKGKNITDETLRYMTDHDIDTLIPSNNVGLRVRLRRQLKQWKSTHTPVLKIWSNDRVHRKCVALKNLDILELKEAIKAEFGDEPKQLFLEKDGTEINDNTCLKVCENEVILFTTQENEKWISNIDESNILTYLPCSSTPSFSPEITFSDDGEFKMPALPEELIKTLSYFDKKPDFKSTTQLVHIISDSIYRTHQNPGRRYLKKAAKIVVKNFPSLADKVNGEILDTGYFTFFRKLVDRMAYLNRPKVKSKKNPLTVDPLQ